MKTKISPTAIRYILTIMDDDVEAAEKRKTEIWEARKNEIVLKGFRKGKVPRKHAENIIGYDNLYEDYVREVVMRGCGDSGERIVGVGQVVVEMLAEGKPTVLRAEIWLEPSVTLTDEDGNNLYEGLEYEPAEIDVEDAEIDALLQRHREASATTTTVEREAGENDVVVVDFEGKLADGTAFAGNTAKDYQIVVGGGTLLADFERGLLGVSAGDEKDIPLTFPETWPTKALVNKEAVFHVVIKEVRERNLPELDDEFAKQMGYEDMADARQKLREALELNKQQQSNMQVEQQLLTGLLRTVPMDPLPEVMIHNQVEQNIQNLLQGVNMTLEQYLKKAKATEEQLRNQQRQAAVTDIRARLILKEIAEREEIELTPEEIEQGLKSIQPQFNNMDLETLRQQIDMDILTLNLRVQRAMDLVKERAVAKKKVLQGPQPGETLEVNDE